MYFISRSCYFKRYPEQKRKIKLVKYKKNIIHKSDENKSVKAFHPKKPSIFQNKIPNFQELFC